MSITDIRRKYLLQLLADLDQQIADAKSLAINHLLTGGERGDLTAHLAGCHVSLKRVEMMLRRVV
jgi:hypothetical protein